MRHFQTVHGPVPVEIGLGPANVLEDAVVEQRSRLHHDPDLRLPRFQVQGAERYAVGGDHACRRRKHSAHHVEHRGLARPRFTYEGDALASTQRPRHVDQRRVLGAWERERHVLTGQRVGKRRRAPAVDSMTWCLVDVPDPFDPRVVPRSLDARDVEPLLSHDHSR